MRDSNTAMDDLLELLRIAGPSTQEAAVAEHLTRALLSLGIPPERIFRDHAYAGSEYGGQCGNLVVRFPAVGNHPGPAWLFAAHMDTVAIAKGVQASPGRAAGRDGAGRPDRQ